jgi:hypothetical protein
MRYVIGNSENLLMVKYHRLTLVLAIALALGLAPPAFGAAVKQKTFASAEEGVKALMEAVKKRHERHARDPRSGSQVPHRIGRSSFRSCGSERFVKSYEESNKLVTATQSGSGSRKRRMAFPIPLVKESGLAFRCA